MQEQLPRMRKLRKLSTSYEAQKSAVYYSRMRSIHAAFDTFMDTDHPTSASI